MKRKKKKNTKKRGKQKSHKKKRKTEIEKKRRKENIQHLYPDTEGENVNPVLYLPLTFS
jgi:hypothetical protein